MQPFATGSRTGIMTIVAVAALISVSCSASERALAPVDVDVAFDKDGGDNSPMMPIYGHGALNRATPKSPCKAGAFRQLDFWVGEWLVSAPPSANVAATSRVSTILDGCVVSEDWRPLNGRRGRSLSSYDPTTGLWHQTWVPEQGPGARPFRMAGGLRPDGVMGMTGTRVHWFFGWNYVDTYSWTRDGANQVTQTSRFDLDEINIHFQGSLRYARNANLPATSSPGSASCGPQGDAGSTRELDFVLGTWSVAAEHGPALGTSTITTDLSGCLIEENFGTPKGYKAVGWMHYDPIENRHFRTYVDSEGNRIELAGTAEAGHIVMEGNEPTPGNRTARLRMTWSQSGGGALLQEWERSRDGGATWKSVSAMTFTHP